MAYNRKYTKLHVFHNHYPGHPSTCVVDKLGTVDYSLDRFQSKESVFREVARQFGLDVNAGRFTQRVETWRGLRVDLSNLVIPIPDSDAYYTVAFHS